MGWFITEIHHALRVKVGHYNTASVDGPLLYRVSFCFELDMSLTAGEAVRLITEENIDLLLGHPSSKRKHT